MVGAALLLVPGLALSQSYVLTANSAIFLGGIGYEYESEAMANVLNGAYAGPEYEKYFINTPDKYPNTGDNAARDLGAASLEALVRQLRESDPDGTIMLVGGSFGSLVISKVNDNLMADGYQLDNISATLLVNPSDGNGGYAARFPAGVTPPFTGVTGGSPTQAGGMHITSITNQYDLISDAPAYMFCVGCGLAWANAVMGFFFVHPDVYDVNLADPRNFVRMSPDGTFTNITVYTEQLPLTQPLRAIGFPGPLVDALDRLLRPFIEAAYDRTNPSMSVPLTLVPTPDKWFHIAQSIVTGTLQGVPTPEMPPSEQSAAVTRTAVIEAPQSEQLDLSDGLVADKSLVPHVQEPKIQSDSALSAVTPDVSAVVAEKPVVAEDEPENSEPSDDDIQNPKDDELTTEPNMKSGNKVEPVERKLAGNNQPSDDDVKGVQPDLSVSGDEPSDDNAGNPNEGAV